MVIRRGLTVECFYASIKKKKKPLKQVPPKDFISILGNFNVKVDSQGETSNMIALDLGKGTMQVIVCFNFAVKIYFE